MGNQGASSNKVKIFVAAHKNATFFESEILQPIHVGAALSNKAIPGAWRDDEGDNISALNQQYCELTAQYWAWKNYDADYYGFCHYRRYFDFSPERHSENIWGEIYDEFIGPEAQDEYFLHDGEILDAIEGYDVITTEFKDLRKFRDKPGTPANHWHEAPQLRDDDLYLMMGILGEMHPDFIEDAERFLFGNHSCFCNMFIMRKAIFRDYCEWLFPLLEAFSKQCDTSKYNRQMLRTPGHLAERLLNIYLLHHQRVGSDWKMKQVQSVHFLFTDPPQIATPPAAELVGGKPIVPVVLAADDSYAPMLTTTIYSMLANASPDRFYDVIVLTMNISERNQETMTRFLLDGRSASLTFIDVRAWIHQYKLETNNAHISVETYYRFLIQDILPHYDKAIYLDADLLVKGDIAELYDVELGENLIGAVIDFDYLGILNIQDQVRYEYSKSVLCMEEPYDYFQAGVLVMNIAALRKEIPVETWLNEAQNDVYIFNDQDILNKYCQGRVTYVEPEWNVMHDGLRRIEVAVSLAPADQYARYLESRKNEKIIHYAGGEKPWKSSKCDRFAEYWRYARETPYYEVLLTVLAVDGGRELEERRKLDEEGKPAISEDSVLRKIADPILPYASRRREFVRSVALRLKDLRDGSR